MKANFAEAFTAARPREACEAASLITEDELARSVGSMLGHIRHADTLAARQKFFDL
jgi:hypothetical protein